MSSPIEAQVPGHRLKQDVADRVQRAFVERFLPESLPRISPPFWGKAFEAARRLDSSYLTTPEFLTRRHVLCLVNTALPKPARKFQRPVYLCRSEALAGTLTRLHWSTHGDFYIFDRTCEWFVVIMSDHIYQMEDSGLYTILVGGA